MALPGVRVAIGLALMLAIAVSPMITARAQEEDPATHSAKAHRPTPVPTPLPLPQDLKIPSYPPGPPTFHDGETLFYEATWLGTPAARARVVVSVDRQHPEWWHGEMWVTSSAIVDLLYRMRDYFSEDFRRDSYQPDHIYIQQHEKQRFNEWHTTFDHDDHIVTAIRRGSHGKITTRLFSGGNPLGPFSGVMMALSQPLKPGDDLTFDVFSGGNRYVFAFNVTGRERITTALGTFDTLKIEPSVIWLSEGSFRSQARRSTIWVTDDKRHLPVRIAATVFFGEIYADLVAVAKKGSKGTAALDQSTPVTDGAPDGADYAAPAPTESPSAPSAKTPGTPP